MRMSTHQVQGNGHRWPTSKQLWTKVGEPIVILAVALSLVQHLGKQRKAQAGLLLVT
jgi:hypothetical protein